MIFLKARLRKLLSAPFSLSDTASVGHGETYQLIASCQPSLKKDGRMGAEPVTRKFAAMQYTFNKFIYTVQGSILLDTSIGWALSGFNILYYSNSSLAEQMAQPIKPNFFKWLRNRFSAFYYPEVVWMPFGTSNYWHFINDFIGAIFLLKDVVAEQRPVVLVHKSLKSQPFFQELVGYSTFLSALNFQFYGEDKWIRCSSLITARTFFGTQESLQDAISLLDKRPAVTTEPTDKIFISRAANTFRNASNITELDELLASRGFRVVLFDGLSVRAQIDLVNSARVIVALHGAGMVNLAFHQQPMVVTVVEITANDYLNPCFAYLAEESGMDYHCLGAGSRDPNNNFNYHVPLHTLAQLLDRLTVG